MNPTANIFALVIVSVAVLVGYLAYVTFYPNAQIGTQVHMTTACKAPPGKFLQMPSCSAVGAMVNGTSISFSDVCGLKDGQNATLVKQSLWPLGPSGLTDVLSCSL